MDRSVSRKTDELAQNYVGGTIDRRRFVLGLLGLGISIPFAGEVLAACTANVSSSTPHSGSASGSLSGTVRFLIGPWTENEKKYQTVIGQAFTKLHPKVNFTFDLFDWDTSSTQVNNSLIQNAHDIYYTGESGLIQRQQTAGIADLSARVNDPAFAAQKAKYINWDRIAAYGPKIVGLPLCADFEDVLYVNMDMVNAAGYDETFVDDWDTFAACVTKMTKGKSVYGFGMGMQLGGYGEHYQWIRASGGRYLTPDKSAPAVNTPEVEEGFQRLVDLWNAGIVPPQGLFTYDTAPQAFTGGRMAIYSSDLSIGAVLQTGSPPPKFNWKILPWPPGVKQQLMFNDLGFYSMSDKMDQDLGWEVLKFWTNGPESAYWCSLSGVYPSRSDALANGYSKWAVKQITDAQESLQKVGVGPEAFKAYDTVDGQAYGQFQKAYSGQITVAKCLANVEAIINHEVFTK